MQAALLYWFTRYLQLARLCVEYCFHTFMVMWYESEIKYFEKRIAEIDRELADLERS